MALNSIGSFDFISLEAGQRGGAPDIPQLQAVPVQRAGVDGTGIMTFGSKGMPEQIMSVRDVASVALGNDLVVAYRLADRSEAVELVFQGVNYFTEYGVKYFILRVDQPTVKRVTGSVGGVMGGGAGALVTAVWTVIAVKVPVEGP